MRMLQDVQHWSQLPGKSHSFLYSIPGIKPELYREPRQQSGELFSTPEPYPIMIVRLLSLITMQRYSESFRNITTIC